MGVVSVDGPMTRPSHHGHGLLYHDSRIVPGGSMLGTITARIALPRDAVVDVQRPRKTHGRRPSVFVVIPCYNYGHYLAKCVQSVIDQQDVDVNILIIDDASPDGSASVVRQLAEQDERISAICHEKNMGHIATYNEGLAATTGDYTVLLSADDLLTPGCLSRATSLMENNPSVGMTYGFAVKCSDAELPHARTVATSWIIWNGHSWIANRCHSGHNVLRSPEAVIRTSVLRQIGVNYRSDLPHTGDFEMWMRAATVSDIAYIGGADQAYYRIHESNMHHSSFDLLADMTGRLRAFDTVFAERVDLLPSVASLRDTAHRTLALEALRLTLSAYARGVADEQPVEEYIAFALATHPDVKKFREWHLLASLRNVGDHRGRPDLPLFARERRRSVQYALNWRRWRWVGVY
jgi:glycosyltransferase involved in cell wall biosynthesis